MKWLDILLTYVVNIRVERSIPSVQKVFLIENDFWNLGKEQLKTDKGFLYRVDIDVERKCGFTGGFDCFSDTCYPLKYTNLGYVVLKYSVSEDIISFLNSPEIDKFLWRFRYFFTDEPIGGPRFIERYEGKIQEFSTYKLLKKSPENKNSIKLKNDGPEVRMKHIKERFKGFIWMKLLKFNEYTENVSKNKMKEDKTCKVDDDATFDLHYFENYSECFENLKKFIKDLCYFKLIENGVLNSFVRVFSKIFIKKTTILMVSQFEKLLAEKFNENLTILNLNKVDKNLKILLNRCCDYLKDEMLENKIFFPIGGKYNINYYVEQLCDLIYESVKQKQKRYGTVNPKDKDFFFYRITRSLKFDFKKLQLNAVQELCESEYIPKHFSEFLGKDVETLDDYIKVEKVVCDYYNMFVYIVNLYHEFNNKEEDSYVSYSYFHPIFIDNYNLKIIEGIEIDFGWPVKFREIRGFDDKGEEVVMVKDTDYFIDEFIRLYCVSEVLKTKNIHEIEIISSDDKQNYMKFKVNEYLNI